jgi:hypothetical protein
MTIIKGWRFIEIVTGEDRNEEQQPGECLVLFGPGVELIFERNPSVQDRPISKTPLH